MIKKVIPGAIALWDRCRHIDGARALFRWRNCGNDVDIATRHVRGDTSANCFVASQDVVPNLFTRTNRMLAAPAGFKPS